MYRPALRVATATPFARSIAKAQAGKRFASTAANRSGSWRGAAARWALAGGLVYYYNTAAVFAEEPQYVHHAQFDGASEAEKYSTVASVAEQRRAQARAQLHDSPSQSTLPTVVAVPDGESAAPGDPGALEEEAGQQGAFNEETGEINWDCPCLGGMAYGPCGEQFRAAFSCFVFSKDEPKGVDCIEHFKTMQTCFREHPEVYGSELDDEEAPSPEGTEGQDKPVSSQPPPPSIDNQTSSAPAQALEVEKASSESGEAVPKAWHDSSASTTAK